ncbi:lytic transglycosylase domain-containing protein [Porphyromonas sp. COT-290 OH860]|uniref:lytic transglycosylase domain-containing protein n=1 Tax=Porphyromonas sp. COT-290 OH860 TaxID=1515615 RepID=UPI0005C61455|nr:lytic transglycosylase domain-containing protein [Porphyromonas sp. COT-290 OH860]
MKQLLRHLSLSISIALLVPSLSLGTELDTLAHKQAQHTSKQESTVKKLPNDKFHLSASLDLELEKLLQGWYEGYSRRGSNWGDDAHHFATPNVHDSVYIKLLDQMPSAIRMSYNPLVRESIELYLYRRRPLLSTMLSLADLYFPEIEMALDRNQLPLELKYLTIVESALNPSAVSPMGAAGLWQLMLPTGKIYGLKINSLVDERLDPTKSTEAACRLLKELHNMYGDWFLVMAAYNCGPGNVNRAIRKAGGGRQSFWDIYEYLPRETRRYVPLFIGAYFAMYYHKEHNIQPRVHGTPLATDYYIVRESTSIDRLSELSGISREQIKTYNPQFRRGIIPGNTEPYPVRLPIAGIMKLEELTDSIKAPELSIALEGPDKSIVAHKGQAIAQKTNVGKTHKVRRGETLSTIARKHKVSVKQLQKWNKLSSTRLQIGQKLRVSAS